MPSKTIWPIGLSLSFPALRGHKLRDLKNFQTFLKKKFLTFMSPKLKKLPHNYDCKWMRVASPIIEAKNAA